MQNQWQWPVLILLLLKLKNSMAFGTRYILPWVSAPPLVSWVSQLYSLTVFPWLQNKDKRWTVENIYERAFNLQVRPSPLNSRLSHAMSTPHLHSEVQSTHRDSAHAWAQLLMHSWKPSLSHFTPWQLRPSRRSGQKTLQSSLPPFFLS